MSELTLTESEVLTDNTDVICSTSIERIVTGRNAALAAAGKGAEHGAVKDEV